MCHFCEYLFLLIILTQEKHGILEGPNGTIRLYEKDRASYFRSMYDYLLSQFIPYSSIDYIPRHQRLICVTIGAQKAADLGVKFFHTGKVDLFAVGKNGRIPPECVRSVVELEMTKETLS